MWTAQNVPRKTLSDIVVVRGEALKLFSYVVAMDYGFAPNPFFGVCTLATCKPGIRRNGSVGDLVIGTGSSPKGQKGNLVYYMRITETMTFNEYWVDLRFQRKKPNLRGSNKQAFGDNIYFKNEVGQWQQRDSHHSYKGGLPNPNNIRHDTQADRVLLSTDYSYWGGSGPQIPQKFRYYNGCDICALRGYKCRFPEERVKDFVVWIQSQQVNGFLGAPSDW